MSYESIIGLEIHIELGTKSKMFCSCPAAHFGKEPNTLTCPVCLGLPGALPVPNKKAIEGTVLTGLALGCQIPLFSKFDRKNYFYPDLPKGFQISQYDLPLAEKGSLKLKTSTSAKASVDRQNLKFKTIRIRRVHLEEDTAKLIHQQTFTLIDFNRSGVPLMEIVTEPDLDSSQAVKSFLQKLQHLVRYLGISEADMEKGQMRCEPTINLKISKGKQVYFTPLVELKNINSFRFVQKALDYEIQRQQKEFEETGEEKQQGNKTTRGWDETKNLTVLQRQKEEAHDYRYFPEPDIPPIRWTQSQISELQSQIPELPEEKKKRFIKNYNLSEDYVEILTETHEKADFFEKAVKVGKSQELTSEGIANVIVNKRLALEKLSPEEWVQNLLSRSKKMSLSEKKIDKVIKEVLQENPQAIADYKKGKQTAIEFFVGQVARKTKGWADPNQTRKLLLEKLK